MRSHFLVNPEAATRGFLQRNVFLKIPQILQQNTCAIVFYVIKLQASACNFIKEEALVQVFLRTPFLQNYSGRLLLPNQRKFKFFRLAHL